MAHIKTIFKKIKSTLCFFLCAVSALSVVLLAHRTSPAKALHSRFQTRVPSGEWQRQHLCSAGLCAEAPCMTHSPCSAQRCCTQLRDLELLPTRKTSTLPPTDKIPIKQPRPWLLQELAPLHSLIKE